MASPTWFLSYLLAAGLTLVGVVMLTLGVRGRPVFALPRCRRCKYDLRNMQFMSSEIGNCPECGTSLAVVDAVTFGNWRRQPRRIMAGVALITLPWALLVPVVSFVQARQRTAAIAAGTGGPQDMKNLSTPALLASLPKNLSTPWAWQELERRLKAGTLSGADVDAAFAVLAADLNAARAAGKNRQPLHWADRFLTPAIASGAAGKPAVDALCQAYYGLAPQVTLRTRARVGEPILIASNSYESWDLPGMQRCWAITGIVVDGTIPLVAQDPKDDDNPLHADALSGGRNQGEVRIALPHALPPGEHELALAYEVGTVSEQATFGGLDGRPGTPEKWPSPVAKWQSVVKRKLTIVPAEQSPVSLIADEAKSPFRTSTLTIEQAMARPSSRGVDIVLRWKFSTPPSPFVSYRISLQAGAERIEAGTVMAGTVAPNSTVLPGTTTTRLKSLPQDVRTVDVLLTPDAKAIEHHVGVEEIWGQPLEIKGIPLQRFDLKGDE